MSNEGEDDNLNDVSFSNGAPQEGIVILGKKPNKSRRAKNRAKSTENKKGAKLRRSKRPRKDQKAGPMDELNALYLDKQNPKQRNGKDSPDKQREIGYVSDEYIQDGIKKKSKRKKRKVLKKSPDSRLHAYKKPKQDGRFKYENDSNLIKAEKVLEEYRHKKRAIDKRNLNEREKRLKALEDSRITDSQFDTHEHDLSEGIDDQEVKFCDAIGGDPTEHFSQPEGETSEDMVYYKKEDTTMYSKGLKLNKIKKLP